MSSTLLHSDLPGLRLLHRGKVRDVFDLEDGTLLMVASDRLSAFDVVLPDPIPGKGELLTRISNHWFRRTGHLSANHLVALDVAPVLPPGTDSARYAARSVIVRKLTPVPVEAIVRGHLAGSGWADYLHSGAIAGQPLPTGLRQADALPEPLFTPSSKAAPGEHDLPITFADMTGRIGADLATRIRDTSLALYAFARSEAARCGLILADTKFEFGLDEAGRLVLMDELLTPDSSRYWLMDGYAPGGSPPSFDKQYVRDYLDTLGWNRTPPGPRLPPEVIDRTRQRYLEALHRLTGQPESAHAG